MKGENRIMPTKLLTKDEILPASELRTLSQKDLLSKVESLDKMGLIANNDVKMALLSWEKYEGILDLIDEKDKMIFELENLLEDLLLAKNYKEDVLNVDKENNTYYKVSSVDELFNMLD